MHWVKMENLKFRFSHLKDNRLQLDRIKAIISTLEDLMYHYCYCIKLMFTCKTALVFSVSSSLIGLVGWGGASFVLSKVTCCRAGLQHTAGYL